MVYVRSLAKKGSFFAQSQSASRLSDAKPNGGGGRSFIVFMELSRRPNVTEVSTLSSIFTSGQSMKHEDIYS